MKDYVRSGTWKVLQRLLAHVTVAADFGKHISSRRAQASRTREQLVLRGCLHSKPSRPYPSCFGMSPACPHTHLYPQEERHAEARYFSAGLNRYFSC